MNIFLLLILMGLIGAFIGWVTNVVAIRLLFRPYRLYRIPLLGWRIQGLIPKRQTDIAVALGEIISKELITGNDVLESLSRKDIKARLREKTEKYVREQVCWRLPFLIPEGIQASVADFVAKILGQELAKFLDNPRKFFQDEETNEIKSEINRIVVEKVKSLNVSSLEDIVYAVARRELKHIEKIGGVLGFIIGVVQGIISIYWNNFI
jgi:uncharacterized membrane protein YheB (UPF0754 family)